MRRYYDLELASDGKLIFTPLPTKGRRVSYIRKDGLILGVTDPPITWEETRQAMNEFP